MSSTKDLKMKVGAEIHAGAESVKYILHYGGEKLDELRQYVEKWLKSIEDGELHFDLHHGVAVARCLGEAAGLITGDNWIDAGLDTIAFKIYDILKAVEDWYRETDKKKKAELLEHLKKDVIECCFDSFEEIVNKNNGLFSKKLTWLDFFFVAAVEIIENYLGSKIIASKYPALLKLTKKIWELPQIKDYISKRKSEIFSA